MNHNLSEVLRTFPGMLTKDDILKEPYEETATPLAHIRQEILEKDKGPLVIMAEGTPEENHEKIVELDKKTNICETCNTIFYNEKEFGQHLLTHVTEKAYQCGVCDGYFTFKRSLIQHLLTHTGTFTECLVCNKKFGLNVTQHLLTRHVKKTPYMCHSCNMAFWKRNSLDKHLNDNRIHKRAYACHVCKKKCTKRLCLKRHLKTHARCHLCDKSFPDSRILDEHMLLHRERVYLACNMCNEVFEDSHRRRLDTLQQIIVQLWPVVTWSRLRDLRATGSKLDSTKSQPCVWV
ncbi:Zinc finger protein 2 [Araneus ventricosus]|uniref:Zinc finger protein 2 n=1 Tax=Araneus ventricosus TaxID=182803 RepID=A0A4Y2IW66_ARAVE|nr:Zinc finger protein 2 [Araneus ventricosus]